MDERVTTWGLFRGVQVWAGIAMGVVGMVGADCGVKGLSTMTFLGGMQLGMGVVWNRCRGMGASGRGGGGGRRGGGDGGSGAGAG